MKKAKPIAERKVQVGRQVPGGRDAGNEGGALFCHACNHVRGRGSQGLWLCWGWVHRDVWQGLDPQSIGR